MIESRFFDEFSYLQDVIYADTSSVGMMPQRTLDVCTRFQRDFAHTYGRNSLNGKYGSIRRECLAQFAALIGADPSDTAIVHDTTEGLNLLAHSLDFVPGDNVISADNEYPSVVLPFAALQEKGLELRLVPTENGCWKAEDLFARMDGRTKLVCFSLAHNHTGFLPDWKRIGEECCKRGILFALDGIQALGRVAVDVKAWNIDYLCAAGFKGMLGGFGTGCLYCRRELQPMLKPLWIGYANTNYEPGMENNPDHLDVPPFCAGLDKLASGAPCTYAAAALGTSLGMLNEIGIDAIWERIRGLEQKLRASLKPEIRALSWGGTEAQRSAILCLRVTAEKEAPLRYALEKARIICFLENGLLRISLHFFNTEEQMEKIASVLNDSL